MVDVVILFARVSNGRMEVPEWCFDVGMVVQYKTIGYVEEGCALEVGFTCELHRCVQVVTAIGMHLVPNANEGWVIGFELVKDVGEDDMFVDRALRVC